jgi:hypothetical protein
MKLRADITITIDASDYISAADHQRAVETLFLEVRQRYDDASLNFRQIRERFASQPQPGRPKGRGATGALAVYDD